MKLYRVEDKYCCTGQEFYELQQRLDAVLRVDGNGDGVWPMCRREMIIGGNTEYAFITMYRISSSWK